MSAARFALVFGLQFDFRCVVLYFNRRAKGKPHWTGWDAKTQRLVVAGREPRLFLEKLNQVTGAVAMDDTFHDVDGKPGFNFADREWPHGWKGSGLPHGVVFSR